MHLIWNVCLSIFPVGACWFPFVEMGWYLVLMELMFYADICREPFYLHLLTWYYVMLEMESQGATYPDTSRQFTIDISWICCLPHTQLVSLLNQLSRAGIKYPIRVADCYATYPMGSWHKVPIRYPKVFGSQACSSKSEFLCPQSSDGLLYSSVYSWMWHRFQSS